MIALFYFSRSVGFQALCDCCVCVCVCIGLGWILDGFTCFERRSFTFCASLAILCAFLGGEPTFRLTLEYKLALERPFQMTFTVIESRNSPRVAFNI